MLNMYSFYGGPSYPEVPDPPETPVQTGVQLGLGLLSRWPIRSAQAVEIPAVHRTKPPVLLFAVIDHPAGPLPVASTTSSSAAVTATRSSPALTPPPRVIP